MNRVMITAILVVMMVLVFHSSTILMFTKKSDFSKKPFQEKPKTKNSNSPVAKNAKQAGNKFYVASYTSHTTGKTGKKMKVPYKYYNTAMQFKTSKPKTPTGLLFVCGASHNHFLGLNTTLTRMERTFRSYKVIFYDLGLRDERERKIIASHRDVEFRNFSFSSYPPHVADLLTYAFKVIIFTEILREWDRFYWFDATYAVHCFSEKDYYLPLFEDGKVVTNIYGNYAHHNIFRYTFPGMYPYFQPDMDMMVSTNMIRGGFVFVSTPSEPKDDSLLHWLVVCALDPNCISPKGAYKNVYLEGKSVKIKNNSDYFFTGSHRFDQAAMSILLADRHSDVQYAEERGAGCQALREELEAKKAAFEAKKAKEEMDRLAKKAAKTNAKV